jgi:hypothetical protein
MSMSLYFNHNFLVEYRIALKLVALDNKKCNIYVRNKFILIQIFTMPKWPLIKDCKPVRICRGGRRFGRRLSRLIRSVNRLLSECSQ